MRFRVLNCAACVALLGTIALAFFADHQNRGAFERRQHAQVYGKVNLLRANLEGTIRGEVQRLAGLVAVIKTEPGMDQDRFERLVHNLVDPAGHVRVVAAAPDFVIRMVYPPEGNAGVLGLDYRDLPEQWPAARRTRETGRMVLAGPLELVQGGEGIAIRAPVVLDGADEGRFWGVVSSVLDPQAIYAAAGLLDPDLPIEVALVGRDGLGGAGELFFGDAAVLASNPVTAVVSLPEGGRWLVAAIPRGGWQTHPPRAWLVWLAVFGLGALVVIPLPVVGRLAEERRKTIGRLKEREREFERVSRRLDLALRASGMGVWDYNVDRDELSWDARMHDLYGTRPGVSERDAWYARLHPEDRAMAESAFRKAVETMGRLECQYRLRMPDGNLKHVRAIGAVYRADDETKVVGLSWDVTADVAREAELECRRREAEAANVAKSRFLAIMSHEIRTPMSGLLGMLDLLIESRLDAEQRGRAELARASAETLLTLLNDILDLSKLEAERVVLEPTDVDVHALVREVGGLFEAQAAGKGLALEVEIAPDLPQWLVCDPVRLRQIIANLVSNAIKFTDAGRIGIRAGYTAAAAELVVAVEDTGIGIPAAAQARLFEPFTQLEGSLDRGAGGTGLGLAICRQLAELMGGTIALQSTPGRGSVFTLRLRAEPGMPHAPAEAEQEPVARRGSRPLEVLVVEDNRTNQLVVSAALERAGHRVTVVDNGSDALAQVAPGRFDVVLMDVQMPRMDGPTTTRAIRARGPWAERLPIIALTANAMAGDRERYLELGMSDYLAKPVDPRALVAAIERAAAEPAH